jgi:hypothetical protein
MDPRAHMRRQLVLCLVAIGLASTVAGSTVGASTTATAREGGTFRVAFCFGGPACFDYVDPAP